MHSPDKIAIAFTALSHKRRVIIYRALRAAGAKGLTHGALQAVTRLSAMSLTHHLRPMLAADLVRRKRRGVFAYYSQNAGGVFDIVDTLAAETTSHRRAA